jgi:GTP-binding protein
LNIDLVEFVVSAARLGDFPTDRAPEVAIIGRSNVGKSRLINALVRRTVARTSATPGKTRLVNFFRVRRVRAAPFYLVDLPGYGHTDAKRGRQAFDEVTRAYFSGREALRAVLLLVDGRHPGMASDLAAGGWIASLGLDGHVVATKLDKLSRAERIRSLAEFERIFQAPVLATSAETGEGLDELWRVIVRCVTPKTLR